MRLPGKGNSYSHGVRPVHQIISMIKRIRTSKLSINKSLSGLQRHLGDELGDGARVVLRPSSRRENNYFTEMCSGSEAGSYFRRIDCVYHSTLGLIVIKKKI